MAYTANLGGNQQLTIANQGTQTVITLFSSSSGQQQSQSSSVTTGNWTSPPQLYQTGAGWVLQINGDRSQIDLPKNQKSGLTDAERVLKGTEGIGFVELEPKDVVRHRIVKRIIKAYNKAADSSADPS